MDAETADAIGSSRDEGDGRIVAAGVAARTLEVDSLLREFC